MTKVTLTAIPTSVPLLALLPTEEHRDGVIDFLQKKKIKKPTKQKTPRTKTLSFLFFRKPLLHFTALFLFL